MVSQLVRLIHVLLVIVSLLIQFQCSVCQGARNLWTSSMGMSSVNHTAAVQWEDRQVVITSFSFKRGGNVINSASNSSTDVLTNDVLQPPQWVTHYLQPPIKKISDQKELHCYFEMMGYISTKRKSLIGNINGSAVLRHEEFGINGVKCRYRNTFIQTSLEGVVIPLAYYCPVNNPLTCERVIKLEEAELSKPEKHLRQTEFKLSTMRKGKYHMTLIVASIYKPVISPDEVNIFTTNISTATREAVLSSNSNLFDKVSSYQSAMKDESKHIFQLFREIVNLRSRRRNSLVALHSVPKYSSVMTENPTLNSPAVKAAVCLVLPYYSGNLVQKSLLIENIRWYREVLGFRVMIYDAKGAHYKLFQENGLFGSQHFLNDYHSYTMFDILNIDVRPTFKILDTDYDKSLSLTHCRMEVRALYDIQSVLVVDADEFLYCENGQGDDTHKAPQSTASLGNVQREAVQALLNTEKMKGIDQLSFTRYSAKSVVGYGIRNRQQCMADAARSATRSIFSCFAPINQRRGNFLPKSIALNYKCPGANTHESCVSVSQPGTCSCLTAVPTNCFVIHVRLEPLKREKEVAKRTKSMDQGDRLELEHILSVLPRPRFPRARNFNRTRFDIEVKKAQARVEASTKRVAKKRKVNDMASAVHTNNTKNTRTQEHTA